MEIKADMVVVGTMVVMEADHKVSHHQTKQVLVMVNIIKIHIPVIKIQENGQQIKVRQDNNKMVKNHSKNDGERVTMQHFIVSLFLQNGLEPLLEKVVL